MALDMGKENWYGKRESKIGKKNNNNQKQKSKRK